MPSGTGKTEALSRGGGQPPTEAAPAARRPGPGVPLAKREKINDDQ